MCRRQKKQAYELAGEGILSKLTEFVLPRKICKIKHCCPLHYNYPQILLENVYRNIYLKERYV